MARSCAVQIAHQETKRCWELLARAGKGTAPRKVYLARVHCARRTDAAK